MTLGPIGQVIATKTSSSQSWPNSKFLQVETLHRTGQHPKLEVDGMAQSGHIEKEGDQAFEIGDSNYVTAA